MEVGSSNSDLFAKKDVEQIKLLIKQRPDIAKPIVRIWFERPDRARVETHQIYFGDVWASLTVYKRHGRWIIDDSSLKQERILVFGS